MKYTTQLQLILPSIFLVICKPSSPPIQLYAIRFCSFSRTHFFSSRTYLSLETKYLCQLSISYCSTGTYGGLKTIISGRVSKLQEEKVRLLKIDVFICWMLRLYFSKQRFERREASMLRSMLTCNSGGFPASLSQLCRLAEMMPDPDPIQQRNRSYLKLCSSCLSVERMRKESSLGLYTNQNSFSWAKCLQSNSLSSYGGQSCLYLVGRWLQFSSSIIKQV